MSEPYWETLNLEFLTSAELYDPASTGIYAHSHGFCDSEEQYNEVTVHMIREFKSKWRKNLHECSCCGQRSIIIQGAGEQCDVCGWYDDTFDEEFPDDPSDENMALSLNEARKQWVTMHKPIAKITEVPIGSPPLWKDVLWKVGVLEQVLRNPSPYSPPYSEDEIQEILSEYRPE